MAENLALHKTAWQQPQTYESEFEWEAGLAVDGVTGTDPVTCECCSGARGKSTLFWTLDLGEVFTVGHIVIQGRLGRYSGKTLLFMVLSPLISFFKGKEAGCIITALQESNICD